MPAQFGTIAATHAPGGNMVVTKPASTVSGDLLLAIGFADPDGTTFNPPSGFTQQGSTLANTTGDIKVWTKVAGGSEPASYTWTADSNAARSVWLIRVTGADTTTPVDVGPTTSTGSSANPPAPSVTTTGTDSLLVCGAMLLTASSTLTFTPPTGMTERGDAQPSGNWIASSVATQELTTSGATGTRTFTIGSKPWNTVTIAIKSAASGGGGTDHTLSATIAASTTTSGSVTARVALAGVVAATSALAGTVTAQHPLSGTVAATTTAAGAISTALPLAGTIAATSDTTGAISAQHPLAGTATAATTTTGAPTLRAPLTGTVAATATTSGSPSSRQGLAGTVSAVTSTSGAFFEAGPQVHPLAGLVAGTTTAAGTITLRVTLAGSTAILSAVAGDLSADHPLAGTVEAVSSASGVFVGEYVTVEVVVGSPAATRFSAAAPRETSTVDPTGLRHAAGTPRPHRYSAGRPE